MKVGIDSYCYHRFFGVVYGDQEKPSKQMTLENFINRAHQLKVDGVSLESCFIPKYDSAYLSEIKGMLDGYNLERVYAWGHPDGLEGGKNEKAYEEMISLFISFFIFTAFKSIRMSPGIYSLQIISIKHSFNFA